MSRHSVYTTRAPKAIGPYNQAVVARGIVTTAGQVAIDPTTGELVGDGDIRKETERVLQNLREVLGAAGSALGQCMRCDVFLADLDDFEAMNEVYATFFQADPPARVTVQAAALPLGARVEIAAIASVLE